MFSPGASRLPVGPVRKGAAASEGSCTPNEAATRGLLSSADRSGGPSLPSRSDRHHRKELGVPVSNLLLICQVLMYRQKE